MLVALAIGLVTPAFGGPAYLREADAAGAIFPGSTGATRKSLVLSDAEIVSLSKAIGRKVEVRSYPYLDVRNDKGTAGVIFMLDVMGQNLPIQFAVGVTSGGALQDLQVMVYREPQGEAIQEARFRKQFVGKRLTDPIAIGKDIDVISGASISAVSATYAARKGLALAQVLRAREGRP
jgi:Na+-translocating ferredoxin:NAD+ oxidoreductase RnfG subunit